MSGYRDRLRRPLPRTVRPVVRLIVLEAGCALTASWLLLHSDAVWLVGQGLLWTGVALSLHAWRVSRLCQRREQAISRIRALELELGLRERDADDETVSVYGELAAEFSRSMAAALAAMYRALPSVDDLIADH